jgi:rSAM/selenodomain-associated transferase 1
MVKTRLVPPLTLEEAASLYECMLHDTIDKIVRLPGITPFICYQDDPGAELYFRDIAPAVEIFPQQKGDLGKRMQQAFARLFARGFREVAIVGSDSPDLPPEIIHEVFTSLEDDQTDVVFGPAEDGGYYLIAMKRLWSELFTGINWSSASVLAESLEIARDAFLGVALLPEWYDIDRPEDLTRRALLDEGCRAERTRGFLLQLRVST